jgi:hypothetical protein
VVDSVSSWSGVWLNSWNSNSYSERGQHRGTRRCGSR